MVLERIREELENVTLQEALLRLRQSAPEAVAPVFAQLERDVTVLRLPLGDALRRTQAQLDDRMWDSCVAVFHLAERTGGSELRKIIGRFAQTMRADLELRRTIRAQQAQQIDSARLTMLMPIGVVVFLRLFYPNADRFYASVGRSAAAGLRRLHHLRLLAHAAGGRGPARPTAGEGVARCCSISRSTRCSPVCSAWACF